MPKEKAYLFFWKNKAPSFAFPCSLPSFLALALFPSHELCGLKWCTNDLALE